MTELDKALAELVANLTLSEVVLVKVDAERLSRSPDADQEELGGWEFRFDSQIADEAEFTIQVKSRAKTAAMSVSLVHQLQYNLAEPVAHLDNDVMGRFLGSSVIPTVAPYVRELVHGLGMRMQCDVPWLNVVGAQSLDEPEDDGTE